MSLTHSIEEVSLEELVEEKALLKEAEDSKELLEEEEEPQESGGSEREHERKVQDMLKQYMESEEYRLLESSYPTKISSTIIFIFTSIALGFFSGGYSIAILAMTSLLCILLIGILSAFVYQETILFIYLVAFAVWILSFGTYTSLALVLSDQNSGIGGIASTRCEDSLFASKFSSNEQCFAEIRSRLMITGLIIAGIIGAIFISTWIISFRFFRKISEIKSSGNRSANQRQ